MNRNRKLMLSTVFALVAIGAMAMFGAPPSAAIIMGLTTFGITMASIAMTEPKAGEDSGRRNRESVI
ncbi:hypothetical protein [Salipiger sp. PrR003]|uniref:hypothetical protein n=1 Tax=Salipiger sp. PrR003 TaxID=2706776 RepID=UPI0013DCB567|nr:hypothetical protein [Salipiger sp. PrR003]NDV50646.1 hypothetical protein [Salipiger sp. PrR003]